MAGPIPPSAAAERAVSAGALNGEPIAPPPWSFDRKTEVLRASFAGRELELEVAERGCG